MLRCNILIQVPYEILNKKFRAAQKVIDREVSLVVSATNDLTNSLGTVPVKVGEITGFLDGVVQKLQSLKRKVTFNATHMCLFLDWNNENAVLQVSSLQSITELDKISCM